MMELPDYIDCNNEDFEHCQYLITDICPNTCAFARDVGGIGIGALVAPVGLEENVSDEYGNMKYVNGKLNPAHKR